MYDVRGVFEEDLNESTVFMLGRAFAEVAGGEGARIAVGRDCRPSGEKLFEWFSRGLGSAGAEALDLGVQTTPMTYFSRLVLDDPAGTVMITGSHNPPEYNGFKMMLGSSTLYGEQIQELADIMERSWMDPAGSARVTPVDFVREEYTKRLISEFCFGRSLKVAVDAGNGTGGGVACEVLSKLGCEVLPLYCEMDGSFPNHHPDPTVVENLSELRRVVVGESADIGIAFDGDADRLGVIDDKGDIVWGDRVLVVLAGSVLAGNPGATVMSEVKASRVFFSEIERMGGRPFMSATGHSIIKRNMAEHDALLAGEMSGHIFFRDRYYGYDDALYAALRLLEILAESGRPLSAHMEDLPKLHSTPEIREPCSEEQKFDLVGIVKDDLSSRFEVNDTDGVRVEFEDGWGLIRASNTQPVLVLRFEATTPDRLKEYEGIVRRSLQDARKELG
jgi:phosphomannomutase/phosphoglucomutase